MFSENTLVKMDFIANHSLSLNARDFPLKKKQGSISVSSVKIVCQCGLSYHHKIYI